MGDTWNELDAMQHCVPGVNKRCHHDITASLFTRLSALASIENARSCSMPVERERALPSRRKAFPHLNARTSPASILRSLFYSLITHRPVTARHLVELLLDTQYFLLGTHRRRLHSTARCTKSTINRRECGQQHSTPLVDAHGAHDRARGLLARDAARQTRILITLSESKIPRDRNPD